MEHDNMESVLSRAMPSRIADVANQSQLRVSYNFLPSFLPHRPTAFVTDGTET